MSAGVDAGLGISRVVIIGTERMKLVLKEAPGEAKEAPTTPASWDICGLTSKDDEWADNRPERTTQTRARPRMIPCR